MRDLFSEHYQLTQDEFDSLWNECFFCFDTNVLLDVYRYTPETRDRLLAVLEHLQERVWIPYQVAKEFHENRLQVIREQEVPYEKISSKVEKSVNELRKELSDLSLDGKKPHPFIDAHQIYAILDDVVERVDDALQKSKKSHPNFLENDPLLLRIADLFEGRVGSAYDADSLKEKYREIEVRYARETPPGYKDLGPKEAPVEGGADARAYGDAVCWFQILDFSKEQSKPILLITGDIKEDWWLRVGGKTIGPRPELIREMRETAGVNYYQYVTDNFLERAEAYLGIEPKPQAVDEIRDVRLQGEKSTASQALLLAKAIEALAQNQVAFEDQWNSQQYVFEQFIKHLDNSARLHITDDQAHQISQAVRTVALALGKRSGRNEFGSVYGELYRKFGITGYKQLPAGKFQEAMEWLNEWREHIEGDLPF